MTQSPQDDWLRFSIFAEKVAHTISERGLKHIVMNRKNNGASHFVRKTKKLLFLSPSRFYEWIQNNGNI